jgi:hypothetical protein
MNRDLHQYFTPTWAAEAANVTWATTRAAARAASGVASGDAAMAAQKQMFIKMCNGEAPWQTTAKKEVEVSK